MGRSSLSAREEKEVNKIDGRMDEKLISLSAHLLYCLENRLARYSSKADNLSTSFLDDGHLLCLCCTDTAENCFKIPGNEPPEDSACIITLRDPSTAA